MKRFALWHFALVVLICILAYGNSLSGDLLWDDEVQIVKNPTIRDLSNIPSAFTKPFWAFFNTGEPNRTNFYRPLQTVAYTISYSLGGLSPMPYHLTSLTLHTLTSIAVYAICAELGFTPWLALLGAALFATHPIHTEAVSWIAGTPDVACGFFYFTALWAFLKSDSGRHRTWWISSALLFFPALLAKEMAITLPALILLLTVRPGAPTIPLARRIILVVPYAAIAALYLAMRVHALGFLATSHTEVQADVLDWITLGIRVFGEYIWRSWIPYPLVAYHLVPLHLTDRLISTLAGLGIIAALATLAWKHRQRFPEGILWYAAFFLTLVPVFYFKGISNTALLSERYLYIPSLAPILLALTVLARTKVQHWIWAAWAVVAIFTFATVVRNQDWSDAEHLYIRTLEQNPDVAHFQINLSEILLKRNDDRAALQHLNRALQTLANPAYAQLPHDVYRAHIGLAAVLLRARDYNRARTHLETAMHIYPKGEWSYLYLGGMYMEKDADALRAIDQFQTAIRLAPTNEVARDYLGMAYFNLSRFCEAIASFEEALKINPNYESARQHLAIAKQALGR
jgi:tetratricopeptide (TPR) repeat protein